MTTPNEVIEQAQANGAEFVDVRFTDVPGLQHHFSMPIHELTEDIFEEGLGFDGSSIRGEALKPDQIYRATRGLAPDLMLFLDDLGYRALGTVGHEHWVTKDDDRGHDGCNHDWDGIFIMQGGRAPQRGEIPNLDIYDFTPTILGLMQVQSTADILGRDLTEP